MRTLARVLVSLAAAALTPGSAVAQAVVGGMAGRVESRQFQDRADDSRSRTGVLVGAFVDVDMPAGPLSVLAEAFFAQRGGRFDSESTPGARAQVQSDVVGFTVAPLLRVGVGPVAA